MKIKKSLLLATVCLFVMSCLLHVTAMAEDANGEGVKKDSVESYKLEQVVVLSRHNIRAPLSYNGSVPQELTPHRWISWTAAHSELTLKGGIEETNMGQYFRKWLDHEGLIPENSIPEEGEVRFNARSMQRCRATARYFSAGMLPLADITIEYPTDTNNLKDFMSPKLTFYSDEFAADATAQVAAMGGDAGFDGLSDETRDAIKLLMDTVDMQDSEGYKSGKFGDLLTDKSGYTMTGKDEYDITGPIKTACQVADPLVLQYYEEPDEKAAAFGHDLTQEDWTKIGDNLTRFQEIKFGAPLVSVNITGPLIEELESELKNEKRKFCFLCAHDCTVYTALVALGVEPYILPDSIETKTPVGVKILFERWRDENDQAWYRVDLLYRSAEQIRNNTVLTLDNPPMRYNLHFEGVESNEDGMISESDFFDIFSRTKAKYAELLSKYTDKALDKAA